MGNRTPKVLELGGLFVLGTEKHETRRIDNQLRGRAGRQGDPGTTLFMLSMEDQLVANFGGDRIKSMLESLKWDENEPIDNGILRRAVESSQQRVEAHNFEIRKRLVEYDDVMNEQRNTIYTLRRRFLTPGKCVKRLRITCLRRSMPSSPPAPTTMTDPTKPRRC